MVRLANERQNVIGNANARLGMFRNVVTEEGHDIRRFYELPLLRNESPALALSWTLFHVVDEQSPLFGMNAADCDAADISLVVVVSGYDVVAAQPLHARQPYDHPQLLFRHLYVDVLT